MSNECTTCCNRGCQSCELCNSGCQVGCDSCEGFCEVGAQNSRNGFEYSSCIQSGQIIGKSKGFTKSTWNEAITRINYIFRQGGARSSRKGCTSPTTASGSQISDFDSANPNEDYLTADEFNRVANAAGCSTRVQSNYYIYGTYFQNLENAVANLRYKSYQCETCNSSCDITCDVCQKCDEGCNGCDSECGNYCCDCCDNNCCDNNCCDNNTPVCNNGDKDDNKKKT